MLFKDLMPLLPNEYEVWYKGQIVGLFKNNDLTGSYWLLDCKVVEIDTDDNLLIIDTR